jgi:selenoprotein W-related protein
LTEKLITEFKARIKRLILVPSDGGRFEVSVDGKQVFSKLKTGRFPEYAEIRKFVREAAK